MGIKNIVQHWSQAMRCNLRCAEVAASIPAMRGRESFLSFYEVKAKGGVATQTLLKDNLLVRRTWC